MSCDVVFVRTPKAFLGAVLLSKSYGRSDRRKDKVSTLVEIVKDNWKWRSQIWNLGLFDLRRQSRGAVLGPAWFFIKPAIYIFVFWFALQVGLRADGGSSATGAPYILWLMAGLIPWFYMQDMLGKGVDLFHSYSYLVSKIKFPLAAIPSIYAVAESLIQLGLVAALLVVYFACGQKLDLYLLQLPVAMLLMIVFFYMFTLMTSCLSAISKDFCNLVRALVTPVFWLSGILFDVFSLDYDWLTIILMFDPVTFIASMYRGALFDKTWIWEREGAIGGFIIVFVATLICTILVYKRTREEVPDVV